MENVVDCLLKLSKFGVPHLSHPPILLFSAFFWKHQPNFLWICKTLNWGGYHANPDKDYVPTQIQTQYCFI